MAKHLKFIARTVMVHEGNVEGAYRTLNRSNNMEMARKINFLMRKNRADPWQGC
ncbi:28S ribosomal protein S21, mitochondrial-like [Marmota marmota marmota]|uniref:28S ribosomal protein S21, mitochondrial-like n=1 Tax=Marmota marmota marmota TaxID=9994 RepID=UPI000762AED5|nr:28S ribosomal protein S21, mitochondrial-like [Marmota marmota marmota]